MSTSLAHTPQQLAGLSIRSQLFEFSMGFFSTFEASTLGTDATTLDFQMGANTTKDDTVSIKTTDMTKDAMIATVASGSSAAIDSSATSGAIGGVIANIDKAINEVNDTRDRQ